MRTFLASVFQDLRYAIRQLRHPPGFALTAIATLALGIGVNIVVFSVLNSLVLQPMNYPNAQQVYALQHPGDDGIAALANSYPDYKDLRDRNTTFSDLAMYRFAHIGLQTSNDPAPVWGDEVSGNYFHMAGVQPYLGRLIQPADDTSPGASAYVVLSYNCWRDRFGSDRSIVGRIIHLNKVSYTVLGVTQKALWELSDFSGRKSSFP